MAETVVIRLLASAGDARQAINAIEWVTIDGTGARLGPVRRGTFDDVAAETLTSNLRLAQYALPELVDARIVRCWTGFEANSPDFLPMAGRLPGWDNLFVLCCVRGGYTIGPYMGRLMGDYILGREPELPLFDPIRFLENHEQATSPSH